MIRNWWNESPTGSSACSTLAGKLKWLRDKLKSCSKITFEQAANIRQEFLGKTEAFDLMNDQGELSEEQTHRWEEVKKQYNEWALREEIKWKERANETWLKEGNKNSSYFHAVASGKIYYPVYESWSVNSRGRS